MTRRIRVALVDDHEMLRAALGERLEREPDLEVVASAGDAGEARRLLAGQIVDVVVLDVEMPGPDSFSAARDIRATHPEVRFIYLSGHMHDQYIAEALAAHAAGYLTKDEPPECLVEAIRKAVAGEAYFSPRVAARLVVGPGGGVALGAEQASTRLELLTAREREVLRYLARGLSKKEIAQVMSRSYSTVDKHAENLMTKLDIHDRVELARFAIREGVVEG